jgi:alpha-beta hydrolase superfamily lysophospholipase
MAPLPGQDPLIAADGLRLAVEHHPATEACRGRLVIVHGYAEHKGRYRTLVAELTAAGYDCHLLDLRGHGSSEGRRGHVSRFAEYRDDLHRLFERVRDGSPSGPPLFLVGHSLGGLISLDYVLHHPESFAALAVSSPYLAPAFEIPPLKKVFGTLVSPMVPTLAVKSGLAADLLSHDPAVVEGYATDPAVFPTVTLGWFREVESTQEEVFTRASEIRLPVLLLVGSSDQIAAPARMLALFERLASPDKDLRVYDGLYHEVFNELEREQVVRDLLNWLEERTR